jgi:plasmid stabilization system protein ParE
VNPIIDGAALRQIDRIHSYIARDNVAAAERVRERIFDVIAIIAEFPHIGHMTVKRGLRQLPVHPYPYIIYFRWLSKQRRVRIVRVLHSAQRRPELRENTAEFRREATH